MLSEVMNVKMQSFKEVTSIYLSVHTQGKELRYCLCNAHNLITHERGVAVIYTCKSSSNDSSDEDMQ